MDFLLLLTISSSNVTDVIYFTELLSGGPESWEAGVRKMVGWEKNPDQMLKTEEAFDQMSARSSHSGNSEDYLCQILNIEKAQEAEDLMNIPTTTLLDLNSPESMVDIQQKQHDSEDSDSDSDSDDSKEEPEDLLNIPTNTLLDPNSPERMVDTQQEQHDSEEEPEDLMNIPTSTLLDANSPERLEDIHQEQHDSEDDQQMELNTPVIIPDLETLLPKGTPYK